MYFLGDIFTDFPLDSVQVFTMHKWMHRNLYFYTVYSYTDSNGCIHEFVLVDGVFEC